jgi:salicylate hydroxylase
MHGYDYATGEVVASRPNAQVAETHGVASLAAHRGDLHGAILAAVRANDPEAVHPGHEFVSLEQDDDGVTVRFANGTTDRAPLVVGADGNGSAIRSFVFGGEPATFNGQVAFRALIPIQAVPAIVREREMAMHRGPDRYLLYYALQGGTLMNLLDLIRAVPDGELFKWGLYDREPLDSWTSGRVTKLGDAAHPMTPFLGQGASMAIEDAVVLARAIDSSGSVTEALDRYQAVRTERGNNVARWSWEEGQALQNPSIENRGAAGYGLLDYDPATVPV